MKTRINYIWRLFATGFCFATFGLGALGLALVVFPLIRLFSSTNRTVHARLAIHLSFRSFLWLMQAIGVLDLKVQHADRLKAFHCGLVIANHPTLIDVVALIALMPNANCIVKRALWNNPFVGLAVRAAGYISNDDSEQLINACAQGLTPGNPLIIFPEGTRSVPGLPLRFKRGTAHIALHADSPILPVIITCTPPTLTKGEKWYTIPRTKAHLFIEVREQIQISNVIQQNQHSVTARQLTSAFQQYFTEAISSHGSTSTGHQAFAYQNTGT